ncbi:hypothetical protein SS25_23360 [Enterobacter hormaechei subsp. hormaechei]|uniref:Uncharacterized protein n=4 Tax=Enterobacteriaceae TaxID=543 RepID=A0A0E3H143_ECOLX|nr:hypothetical protein CFNIH1_24960 [Citrobacter freundii CFNIH1]AIA44606.1 hypothetical protein KPNIH27_25685 [Klebsiella pneumoniae subsp. pneumoniae KPNIH27]AID93270.1 hypothetical protein KONIH1_30495 [Klebsiella oxytoca KONIH1]AIE66275.1 hypothetical protein ECNIH2_23630 [Enterobacter cloacae ECNIH2]AIX76116.1 hypothetical protein PSNIH2_20310 [Pantoea sp. PSNIH2]AKA87172.1 hypothetical protein [Escherichia coli]AUW08094.1 hypothetical protein C2U42_01945 [Klebsiella oxytoca]AUZ72839.1
MAYDADKKTSSYISFLIFTVEALPSKYWLCHIWQSKFDDIIGSTSKVVQMFNYKTIIIVCLMVVREFR